MRRSVLGVEVRVGIGGDLPATVVPNKHPFKSSRPGEEAAAVNADLKELEEASRAFLHKVDELTPHIDTCVQFSAVHGGMWILGNWSDERNALVEALVKLLQHDN